MAKSLASQSQGGAIARVDDFALPAELDSTHDATGLEIHGRFSIPYLVFAQPKAIDQWNLLIRTLGDVEDGDPILMFPEPTKPMKLSPLRFILAHSFQYWVTVDNSGKETGWFKEDGQGRKERILTALYVLLPDDIWPVTCTFRTTKCGAVFACVEEIKASMEPDWIKGGEAFALAVQACGRPSNRVVATVNVRGKTSAGGSAYKLAKATLAPTGAAEWKLLTKLTTSEKKEALDDMAKSYKDRVDYIRKQIK